MESPLGLCDGTLGLIDSSASMVVSYTLPELARFATSHGSTTIPAGTLKHTHPHHRTSPRERFNRKYKAELV